MTNSQNYCQTVVTFQKKMAEITDEYNTTMTRAAQYRGSEAHRKIETDATAKRDADILALKQECWPKFQQIITDMRTAAATRPMIPPTQEMVNLLAVLKMRSTLTVDELKMAENSLKSCPIALAVLDDIARAHDIHHLVKRKELSTSNVTGYIDNLLHAAQRLLKGDGARFERTPADVSDCVSVFGAFPLSVSQDYTGAQHTSTDTETVRCFCEIIDGGGEDA